MPRAFFHDYRSRCIYHITMTKAAGVPAFSTLAGGVDDAHVNLTLLGKMIVAAIFELPKREPAISNLQYVIMPDHIHLLIFIKEQTPKALGSYIGMLKVLAGQLYRDTCLKMNAIARCIINQTIVFTIHKLSLILQSFR